MKTMRFNVQKLLEKMRANAKTHKEEYLELASKNAAHVRRELENALLRMQNEPEKVPDLSLIHAATALKPHDNSRDYERIISMLEATTQDEIELSEQEFDNYYNDEWHWSTSMMLNKMTYGVGNGR